LVSRGRVVIAAAFGALGLGFLGYYLYASLDIPELEKVQLDLASVNVIEVNSIDNRATLEVIFLVTNPSQKTVTISNINYELFANGKAVGNGEYSTEDIALPGRALVYPGGVVELTSVFNLVHTDQIADEYFAITNEEQVSYFTKGNISVESAWSIVEKEFESSIG
jgi:LEA14-like dessication related protein